MSKKRRREMSKSLPYATLAIAAVVLSLFGCNDSPTVSDAARIEKTSRIIKLGSSTATSIGLVAIPKVDEADNIAREIRDVLDQNVLPILGGDEAGLASGLGKLLTLEFLNDPKYAKAKLLLSSALPLLQSNLPDDLLDKPLTKVPADVKAYLTAFFTGVRDGASSYLGDRDPNANKWTELRNKLAE
jgi:hypothetical protein